MLRPLPRLLLRLLVLRLPPSVHPTIPYLGGPLSGDRLSGDRLSGDRFREKIVAWEATHFDLSQFLSTLDMPVVDTSNCLMVDQEEQTSQGRQPGGPERPGQAKEEGQEEREGERLHHSEQHTLCIPSAVKSYEAFSIVRCCSSEVKAHFLYDRSRGIQAC